MMTTNQSVRRAYSVKQSDPCDDSGVWDRLQAGTPGAVALPEQPRRIRVPFLVSFRGRANRKKSLMATAREVNGHIIKLIVREPTDAFQGVRIRPDLDGMQTAWVRGVVTEPIQSVGCNRVHVDCSGRRAG